MKIHEYQGKEILRQYGVPVPRGEVAFAADEARAISQRLGTGVTVVKAQIHAGGRGKGGGVKVVKSRLFSTACRSAGVGIATPGME